MSKKDAFPKTVTVKGIPGITATIYRQKQTKGEAEYVSYTLASSAYWASSSGRPLPTWNKAEDCWCRCHNPAHCWRAASYS